MIISLESRDPGAGMSSLDYWRTRLHESIRMATVNQIADNAISGLKIRIGAAGLHLFDRRTGTNLLIDEIKFPQSFWSVAPRQVSIALLNTCDLNCSHCYAPKDPAILDFEKLKGWLIDLDANGCIGVGFGGGEPTLYPQFAELCTYTTKHTGLAITMTTHAHHLHKRRLEQLEGNVNFIRVSMDGVGSTYESIRGRSFDVLVQRIMDLSEITPFGINYVVNAKTIGALNSAIEIASELGCAEFLLLPEEATKETKGIDGKTQSRLHQWVAAYRGSIPLSVSESGADGLPVCDPLGSEIRLNAFAHIDALGTLKRSSYEMLGTEITDDGVMSALNKLKNKQ